MLDKVNKQQFSTKLYTNNDIESFNLDEPECNTDIAIKDEADSKIDQINKKEFDQ